jgi:PAS domain S-box-containing protein
VNEATPVGNPHRHQPASLNTMVHVSEWQRALEAVGESEERFRTLADCAPVVVWVTDVGCRCTYISQYWRQFTGREPDQDLGFGWVEALHPDDRDRAARDLVEAGKLVQPCRGEYRVKRASGEYGWLFDFGVPHFRADGSYAGHIGTCTDITEHKNRESVGHKVQDNLLLGQEVERKRLSRELHDDIGQRMALVAVALNQIERLVPSASPLLEEKLQAVRQDVELLASDIRRLSHNLHPSTVTQFGLVAALRQLCREFSEHLHIRWNSSPASLNRRCRRKWRWRCFVSVRSAWPISRSTARARTRG